MWRHGGLTGSCSGWHASAKERLLTQIDLPDMILDGPVRPRLSVYHPSFRITNKQRQINCHRSGPKCFTHAIRTWLALQHDWLASGLRRRDHVPPSCSHWGLPTRILLLLGNMVLAKSVPVMAPVSSLSRLLMGVHVQEAGMAKSPCTVQRRYISPSPS